MSKTYDARTVAVVVNGVTLKGYDKPEPRLPATAEALEEFDRTEPERQKLFEAAIDNETFEAWANAEEAAELKVRQAFYVDTCDRNSWDKCKIVDFGTLRRWVAKEKVS